MHIRNFSLFEHIYILRGSGKASYRDLKQLYYLETLEYYYGSWVLVRTGDIQKY